MFRLIVVCVVAILATQAFAVDITRRVNTGHVLRSALQAQTPVPNVGSLQAPDDIPLTDWVMPVHSHVTSQKISPNSDNPYSALKVNHQINRGYLRLAHMFQKVVDPGYVRTSSSQYNPNWFGFAPWASLQVGYGQRAAKLVTDVFNTAAGSSIKAYVQHVCDVELKKVLNVVARTAVCAAIKVAGASVRALPSFIAPGPIKNIAADQVELVAAFWAHLGVVSVKASKAGNMGVIFTDTKIATYAIARMLGVYNEQTHVTSPIDKVKAILTLLPEGLRDGNLRIFGDIGVSGAKYLAWRKTQTGVTPDTVINTYSSQEGVQSANVKTVYDYVMGKTNTPDCDFWQKTELKRWANNAGSKTYLVAAFALWEKAGQTTQASVKNNLISWGNNLLAFREQHDAVRPSFSGKYFNIFAAMTPFFMLEDGTGAWTLESYVNNLPSVGQNSYLMGLWNTDIRIHINQFVWSSFEDVVVKDPLQSLFGRWGPICKGAFEAGYSHKGNIFKGFTQPDVTKLSF